MGTSDITFPNIIAVCGGVGTGATTLAGVINTVAKDHHVHTVQITRTTAMSNLKVSTHGLDNYSQTLLRAEVEKTLLARYDKTAKIIFDCCAAGYLQPPAFKVLVISAIGVRIERVAAVKSVSDVDAEDVIRRSDLDQLFKYDDQAGFDMVIDTTPTRTKDLLPEFLHQYQEIQLRKEG